MWRKRIDFEFFGSVLNFMELGPSETSKIKKFTAFFAFFMLLPFHTVFLVFLANQTSNAVDRARIIQTIPLLVGVLINAFNVKWKFNEIKSLLENISNMTKSVKSQKILAEMKNEKIKIFNFFFGVCIVSVFGTQVSSLVSWKAFISMETPEILAGHENITFLLNWTWETLRILYTTCLSLSIDFLLFYSLSSLKAYAKHLCEDIECSNLSEQNRRLVKRLQQYYELKM